MGGTVLNIITVLIGGTAGLLVGNRLSDRVQNSVVTGLGLVTIVVGIDNAGATGNIIIPLLSVSIGVIIGEILRLDALLEQFAAWLQHRYAGTPTTDTPDTPSDSSVAGMSERERFITGFVTASLVFCVGPLTFLGSIQDGMGLAIGFEQLAIKSVLDGFAAMAFAATFGVGVLFTVITVLVIQGGLALIGSIAGDFMTEPMIFEMTATGGIILLGLSLILLDLKKPRMANFLPGLLVAPLLVMFAELLNIDIYPL